MEITEMQSRWNELSVKIEKQKKLTDSLIIKMTKKDYRNRINKILLPEAIGTLGCFTIVVFILVGLPRLTNWYLLACGIISAALLVLMPILSLISVYSMKSINSPGTNLKQTLENYSTAKLRFVFIQKLIFILGAMLTITILPVTGMLIADKDFFKETNLWLYYSLGFPFYLLFARWVFKSYKKIADAAGSILKELEES